MVNQRFEFLFNRLSSVEVTTNQSLNFELYHYLCEFEFYVYGIFLQYNRIKEDLKIPDKESFPDHDYPQKIPTARLDIYYYTMTWDKLKKVYGKFNNVINRISIMPSPSSANSFKSEYKNWRKRIEHLFLEFGTEIRNEYEHPSLEFYKEGNLKMYGNILIDGFGNVNAHAGNNQFAVIKKDHYSRIQQLRIDLLDIFVKNFSQKPLTKDLLKIKNYIEQNIESLSKDLRDSLKKQNIEDFNEIFHRLMMWYLSLSREGIQIS